MESDIETEIVKMPIKKIPGHLSHIFKPPPHLHVRKAVNAQLPIADKYITVVGPRKPTMYAKNVCQQIIASLQGYSVCIVSGLAYGIDAIAHEEAMKYNLPCIVFPGSGIDDDVLYPRYNYTLAQLIMDEGGALMCEWPTSTRAATWTFPARNRLMAGIADAVIIIEAGEKSGTLITARYALAEGRDVFVVPADITRIEALGSNSLIQHGAHPVIDVTELPTLLQLTPYEQLDVTHTKTPLIHNNKHVALDLLSTKLLSALSSPKNTSQLSQELHIDISSIITSLQELELEDLVIKDGSLWRKK